VGAVRSTTRTAPSISAGRREVAAARSTTHVDEMVRSRHVCPGYGDVESAVRVAGGFPTLGGGARWGARAGAADQRARAAAVDGRTRAAAPVAGESAWKEA
jgi:hypothetical protein